APRLGLVESLLGVATLGYLLAHVGAEVELADRPRLVRGTGRESEIVERVAHLFVQEIEAEVLSPFRAGCLERVGNRDVRPARRAPRQRKGPQACERIKEPSSGAVCRASSHRRLDRMMRSSPTL